MTLESFHPSTCLCCQTIISVWRCFHPLRFGSRGLGPHCESRLWLGAGKSVGMPVTRFALSVLAVGLRSRMGMTAWEVGEKPARAKLIRPAARQRPVSCTTPHVPQTFRTGPPEDATPKSFDCRNPPGTDPGRAPCASRARHSQSPTIEHVQPIVSPPDRRPRAPFGLLGSGLCFVRDAGHRPAQPRRLARSSGLLRKGG